MCFGYWIRTAIGKIHRKGVEKSQDSVRKGERIQHVRDDLIMSLPTSASDSRGPKPRQERQAPMECRFGKRNL